MARAKDIGNGEPGASASGVEVGTGVGFSPVADAPGSPVVGGCGAMTRGSGSGAHAGGNMPAGGNSYRGASGNSRANSGACSRGTKFFAVRARFTHARTKWYRA